MTDAAKPKPEPGWYIITDADGEMRCERFGAKPWDYQFGLYLPLGWPLGPRIEDLLRDAQYYRWLREAQFWNDGVYHHPYRVGQSVNTAAEFDAAIDAEIAREKAGHDE